MYFQKTTEVLGYTVEGSCLCNTCGSIMAHVTEGVQPIFAGDITGDSNLVCDVCHEVIG